MPRRKITIKTKHNPTMMSMNDRQVALDVLVSLRESMDRGREKARSESWGWYHSHEWELHDEQRLFAQVMNAAINQFAGRQKGQGGHFAMVSTPPPEDDMDYVRQSLGIQ